MVHFVPCRLGMHTKVIIFGALRALGDLFHSTADHKKKEVKSQKNDRDEDRIHRGRYCNDIDIVKLNIRVFDL